jgi:hypothetical protein
MKRPDLLLLVAVWQFLRAFFLVVGLIAIAVFAFPGALGFGYGPGSVGAIFGLSIAIFVLLCLIGLSLAGGIGVLKAKNWGRIVSIVNAILGMLNIPIGTAIGILVLIYLARPEIRAYFEESQ